MADDFKAPREYLDDPSRYFLEWLPQKLEAEDDLSCCVPDVKEIAQIRLTGERGGVWHFVVDHGTLDVVSGAHERPSFTLVMSVDTWRDMERGKRSGFKEFLLRRIKIEGSKLAYLRCAKLFT